MAAHENSAHIENLTKALKCTQELRASVSSVFERLSNGLKVTETSGDKDKSCLSDLRECLAAVNSDFEQLEKVANAMQSLQSPLTLGYLGFMTSDPFLDKSPLYQQITQTYKWASKAHSHAAMAMQLLHGNMPKRSIMGGSAAKRLRRPANMPYSISPQSVDLFIQSCSRYFPDLVTSVSHPYGAPAIMQVTIGKTAKALVVMRGIAIEWVIVKGFHEDFNIENGKGTDMWSPSKYLVFQKVTQHAQSMSMHFGMQPISEFGLRQFLIWLNSYKTLFSTPCNKCGKILQNYLPPTWHEVRNVGSVEPYHEQCRP